MSPHILALDVAGAPHRWINVRHAAHYYATGMVAWAAGQHEFVLRGGWQRSTGEQSQIRASSIIAIRGRDFIVRHFDQVPTLTKEQRTEARERMKETWDFLQGPTSPNLAVADQMTSFAKIEAGYQLPLLVY